MKKTKHSEEKMIEAVKQLEAGRWAKEWARELGVTDQTLYNLGSKYSGMDASEAETAGASCSGERNTDRAHPRNRGWISLPTARRAGGASAG